MHVTITSSYRKLLFWYFKLVQLQWSLIYRGGYILNTPCEKRKKISENARLRTVNHNIVRTTVNMEVKLNNCFLVQ